MNHTCLRRATALFLTAVISLSLFSCSSMSPSEKFNALLEELPAWAVNDDSLSVNFLFENPENFGIEPLPYEHDFASQDDYADGAEEIRKLLDRLHDIPLAKLTEDEQLHYRVIEDYFTRSLRTYDYYYLDNTYLGSFLGYQAQLPLLLTEVHFNSAADIDNYFYLLETTKDAFRQYADYEAERMAAGYGMCQDMLDGVIEQCDTLVEQGCDFIADSFNQRIDQADFLSDAVKEATKTRHKTLLAEAFLPAYAQLSKDLSKLTGSPEPLGLAHFEGGQAYFEVLVQSSVGTDLSISGIKAKLMTAIEADMLAIQALLTAHPDIDFDTLGSEFCDFTTAEEAVDYLAQATAADFPALAQLNYTVRLVPESMRDNFSPAAYIVDTIDSPLSSPQSIYLNGDFAPDLFPTIAHEGYPGHMYQNIYYKSLQPPAIRCLIDYDGYTEGWATYVEHYTPQYAPNQSLGNELYVLNDHLSLLITALLDIGVHYDGWTLEQFREQCAYFYGELEEEEAKEMYLLILESPGNYLNYCLGGLLFQQLRSQAEDALGDAFLPVAFHQVLLDAGPASFPILSDLVDAYIEKAQGR